MDKLFDKLKSEKKIQHKCKNEFVWRQVSRTKYDETDDKTVDIQLGIKRM